MHVKTSISAVIDVIISCNGRLGFGISACVKIPEDTVEEMSESRGLLSGLLRPGEVFPRLQ